MAQFHNIKFLHEVEVLSQRQVAQKLGISRNTLSKYLKQNGPPTTIHCQTSYGGKEYSDETKRVLPVINQWLEDDLKRWGKQHHTADRIYRRLVDEYDFKGSESNIRKVVAKRKKNLQKVFIPLDFQLGTNSNSTGERRILFYRVEHNVFTSFVCSFRQVGFALYEHTYMRNKRLS